MLTRTWKTLALMAAAALVMIQTAGCSDSKARFNAMDVTGAPWGQGFSLPDLSGKTVTQADFAGKVTAVFFGFMYCPDACPTHLTRMAEVRRLLGARGDKLQLVFITVDPERDTVEHMAAYVAAVDERLWGLTGSAAQVAQAAKAYRVFYRKATPQGGGEYLVDHTSLVYLMGPDGTYRAHFTHETTPERMAEILRKNLGG
jgi:protein SCO1/2